MNNKKTIGMVVGAIVIAGAAFWGGMAYGKGMAFAGRGGFAGAGNFSSSTFAGRGRAGVPGGANANGGLVAGQVSSLGAQSFTLQLPGGNSEVVFYSSSTMVVKPAVGSISDVTNSSTVRVMGTTNSDGSVTAQTIQVQPAGGLGAVGR